MRFVRTFATADGGSSMEEIEVSTAPVDFVPGNPAFGVSDPFTATNARFLRVEASCDGGWHPKPVPRFLTVLSGGFDVRTTDGKSRRFGKGETIRLDDTTGRGRHTRMIGSEDVTVASE